MTRGRKRRKKKEDVEGDSEESASVRDSESDSITSEEDADKMLAWAEYRFPDENCKKRSFVLSILDASMEDRLHRYAVHSKSKEDSPPSCDVNFSIAQISESETKSQMHRRTAVCSSHS